MNRMASMPATRFGGTIKLLVLFAVQIGFIVAFHAMGSIDKIAINFSDLSGWLESTTPEIALIAAIRILALAFSYWILATSVVYMLARSFHIPGLLRVMEFATIPGVRKIIDAGLAATIVGGTVFGGAAAVFAKQSDASKVSAPAAITSTFKESRPLFNPNAQINANTATPIVNTSGAPSQNSVPVVGSNTGSPTQAKKVVIPIQTPDVSGDQAVEVEVPGGPSTNPGGNYIPTPAERYVPPAVDENQTPTTTQTTQAPKVVIPSDEQTPTTTPKVTVPPTTAPVTSAPEVQVGGQQVTRSEDAPASETTQTQEGSYTVVAGDNFWKIAKNQVQNALGQEPSNAEVANYWVQLIDANSSNIRSGDPDLIFPGEVFTLPPV